MFSFQSFTAFRNAAFPLNSNIKIPLCLIRNQNCSPTIHRSIQLKFKIRLFNILGKYLNPIVKKQSSQLILNKENHVVYSHQSLTNHDISEIFIRNIDGSNQHQITEIGKYSDHPSVSRDGKK